MTARLISSFLFVGIAMSFVGCGGEDPPPPTDNAPFPLNYRDTYTEVRNCRSSGDHDLNKIRILADPPSLEPYMTRTMPFPVDSIVIKEEYEFADNDCTGPIKQWTIMKRLPTGSASSMLDWHWYKVDKERTIVTENEPRCIGCHTACGNPPDGYEGTCAIP
jgi:hypothetical protein